VVEESERDLPPAVAERRLEPPAHEMDGPVVADQPCLRS
jgi:hypothetical protein